MGKPIKTSTARRSENPREFVIIVGGPSNTFNGYTKVDPLSDDEIPAPKPESLDEIRPEYIGPPFGEPNDLYFSTHDLYWANFIDPIHRLFKLGIASPQPGDLVSVLLYRPPYDKRADIDWNASPHNPVWYRNKSPWVLHHPYNPGVRQYKQGKHGHERPTRRSKPPKLKPTPPLSPKEMELRINHEILMRTTSANDLTALVYKRPTRPSLYLDIIHDIPRRCVHGNKKLYSTEPLLKRILVKLLLVEGNGQDQILDYLTLGRWEGKRATHVLDIRTEDEMGHAGILSDTNWDIFAKGGPPQSALRFWEQTPAVDRNHVKIHRLDYFGHSTDDSLFLQYGLDNKKGEPAEAEIWLTGDKVVEALFLKPGAFTPDATCKLWGCYLGDATDQTPMAAKLARVIPRVIACDSATNFQGIIDSDNAMPVPDPGGQFLQFKKH